MIITRFVLVFPGRSFVFMVFFYVHLTFSLAAANLVCSKHRKVLD